MPRGHLDPRPRVFERLVLQPLRPQPQLATEPEQPLLVGTHEMDHALAPHGVAVKAHAPVAGGAHPLAAGGELPLWRRRPPGRAASPPAAGPPRARPPKNTPTAPPPA